MSGAISTAFILLGWSQHSNINHDPLSEEETQPSNDNNKQN